jgi:hypothetical protein
MGFFALLGIPVLAIFTGPMAATQLRSEPNRSAEEPLPFSPIQKVFGAYITNLGFLLAGSAMFLAAAQLFGSLKSIEFSPTVILLAVLQFHLLSFLFSYWLNQPVLGTALAASIIAIEAYIYNQSEILQWFSKSFSFTTASSFMFWVTSAGVISLIGGLISLWIIARRVELGLRTFFLPGLIAYLAAFVGVIVLVVGMFTISYQLQNQLLPQYVMWFYEFISPPSLDRTGAYFGTASGDLVRITPDGRQTLVRTPFALFPTRPEEIHGYKSVNAAWFLVPKDDHKKIYEVLRVADNNKAERYAAFSSKDVNPIFLVERNGKILIYAYSGNNVAFAELPFHHNKNQSLDWKILNTINVSRFSIIQEHALQPEIQAGILARLTSDGKTLTRKFPDGTSMQWSLPGKANVPSVLASHIYPSYFNNGEPYFTLPVTENGKTSILACGPDGSISPVWKNSWDLDISVYRKTLAGTGTGWISWKHEPIELFVISNDGTPFAPISLAPFVKEKKPNWPSAMNLRGSTLSFLINDEFVYVDLSTGKILASLKLKDFYDYYGQPTKEGIYIVKENRICLIDWDGKVRDLGPASL